MNRRTFFAPAVLLLAATASATAADRGALAPTYLRTEYRVNPLGIEERAPRLSWLVESAARGQVQSAYHVLVAGSPEELAKDKGDLWDSGKVESDETTAVAYGGKALPSHAYAFWKVRVWDKAGVPSAWSPPAQWSAGILEPAGWKAQWIGYDKNRVGENPEPPVAGAKWIWSKAGDGAVAPKGVSYFQGEFTLPAGAKVETAELHISASDRFFVYVNDQLAATDLPGAVPSQWVRPVDIAHHVKAGQNHVLVQVDHAADGPAGLLVRATVKTADGKVTTLDSGPAWTSLSLPSAASDIRETLAKNWDGSSRVLGEYGAPPFGKLKHDVLFLPPPPHLRTTFKAAKPVKRATLYATGLGIFDLFLNGSRVTEDTFNPGWTDYNKRVLYRAYDVTPLVRDGENALGAILADGWYSGYIGWGHLRDHYGKKPRFLGQLHVEYIDGTTEEVATGPGWKAGTGAVRESDFLMGESVDARQAATGWDQPGFNDAGWQPVDLGAELKPLVQPHPGPPVRAFAELKARKITQPRPGVYVLDLGQNFAGVPRLTLRNAAPGQKITLRFAERLNADGSLYTINYRGARSIDTYIARGGPVEVFEPRYTFHGFQFIEVAGLTAPPTEETVVGIALSSATPVAGIFESSDPTLNKIHSNGYWTQRSNFIDIPTDCPQRDERLGWTGDAQVYVRTATLNADVQAFFAKWLVDLEDGQRADGQFPMIAPVKVANDDGGPAWADAGTVCPWTIYEVYGDRRLLEKHYPAMTRFIAFTEKRSPDLLPPATYHCFGDWLSINADTPKDVIYTAYFALSTKLTARAAEALGKADDAAKYNALFDRIKAAFNKAFVAEDGRIKGDTQAVYVLGIAFGLLDPEKQKLAAGHLVANIEARDWHLSTGFIGTKDLMLALTKIGREDVAYRLLFQDTFPGWGFSIKQGATSIWERWDGYTPEKGFQDAGMNSFAHYSFGAVYQWVVENVGGIRSDGPSYKKIVIDPHPGGPLTWAVTGYKSIRGEVATRWEKKGNALTLDVTIPANTTATIRIPAAQAADVTEGGKALDGAEGIKVEKVQDGHAVLSVGSGVYRFATKTP